MGINALVSIIIPVYNVEKYVEECLDSVINQTYKNIEIVVVNDGSTDNSLQLCKKYTDPRIIIIDKSNGGLSDARNEGVKASTGEYIIFIDSDDVVHSDLVEELICNLLKYECDISGCDKVAFIDGTELKWCDDESGIQIWDSNEIMKNLVGNYTDQLTLAPYKLYRRNVIIENPFPVGKLHEDEFTAYKILYSCQSFAYSKKKLYGYRLRSSSIMTTFKLEAEKDAIDAKQEIYNFYCENIDDLRAVSRAYFLLMRTIELSYFKVVDCKGNKEYLNELINKFKTLHPIKSKYKRQLNIYEKIMLDLFFYSRPVYILIENIKRSF